MSDLTDKKTRQVVIIRPQVTEKATELSARPYPVYTFVVAIGATKSEISREVEKRFGVKPIKVNVINQPIKQVRVRGRRGQRAGWRKALVFLPTGQSIDII